MKFYLKSPFISVTHPRYMSSLLSLDLALLCTKLIVFGFYLVACSTRFFAPSILKLSSILELKEPTTGILVSVLGNFFPYLFGTIYVVYTTTIDSGIKLVIDAANTTTILLLGLCLIVSSAKIQRRAFLRDSTMLVLSLFVTMIIILCESIAIYGCAALVFLYITYRISSNTLIIDN